MHYLDSSALVKLYSEEDGSRDLGVLLGSPGTSAWSSVIAGVEVVRALRRIGRHTDADLAFDAAYAELLTPTVTVALTPLTPEIVRLAGTVSTVTLRSLDAIHLATALASRDSWLAFVTFDARQAEAARALGLPVESPGLA